jgi:hypothetical protein
LIGSTVPLVWPVAILDDRFAAATSRSLDAAPRATSRSQE